MPLTFTLDVENPGNYNWLLEWKSEFCGITVYKVNILKIVLSYTKHKNMKSNTKFVLFIIVSKINCRSELKKYMISTQKIINFAGRNKERPTVRHIDWKIHYL